MDEEVEEGFAEQLQKGLFTFYREQGQGPQLPLRTRAPESPSLKKSQALPALHAHRDREPAASLLNLSPHSGPTLHLPSRFVQQRSLLSPKGVVHHSPEFTLPLSHSLHRREPTSIVHLNFEPTTSPRRERNRVISVKARAKTEASAASPVSLSSPLKDLKTRPQQKNEPQSYFSVKQEPTLRMKAILLRLSSSKILGRELEEPREEREGRAWRCLKPVVRPIALLPSRPEGCSLNFWEHFQNRKNLLLGRYKRERADRIQQQQSSKRRARPALTNNHI